MYTYQVKRGDTMWRIALMHGISLNELLNANPHIQNASLIYVGEEINIPMNNNISHLVNKGDTMWDISQNYNVPLNTLKQVNPQIKNPNLIYPNQIINIPSDGITPSVPSEPQTPSTTEFSELENEVIRLVNEERRKAGRAELNPNNEIGNVARVKSQDFINNNYFSHNSPVYGTPFDMLRTFGISYTAAAENIASGQRTAREAMSTWMNSSGHRTNILNPNFNQIGVGVARDPNGNLYWTQLFTKS